MQLFVPLATYRVLPSGLVATAFEPLQRGGPRRPAGDRFDDRLFLRIEHGYRVAVGVGDVEEAPPGTGRDAAGMEFHRDGTDLLPPARRAADHRHAAMVADAGPGINPGRGAGRIGLRIAGPRGSPPQLVMKQRSGDGQEIMYGATPTAITSSTLPA